MAAVASASWKGIIFNYVINKALSIAKNERIFNMLKSALHYKLLYSFKLKFQLGMKSTRAIRWFFSVC